MVALGCGAFRNNRSGAMGEIPTRNNSNGEIRPPLLATPSSKCMYTPMCVHCNQMRYLSTDLLDLCIKLFARINVLLINFVLFCYGTPTLQHGA